MYRENGDTITNPYDIANTFNNYFASIAETTKRSIKYSHKHFSDYLSNESSSTIFLQPTDKEEVANIISSLLVQILFLLKDEILDQLADLFNISFKPFFFLLYSKLQK